MRRFIYLDTDTLNSYIAQIYDGLVQTQETETQSSQILDKQSESTSNIGADTNLKVFGKGIEGKIDFTYRHLKDTSNAELISDVQTKLLHDNAFDQLMNYCSRSKFLTKLLKTFDKTFREIFPVFISTKRREKPSAFFDNNFVNNAYFSEAASSSSSHLASSSSKAPISSRMTCLCLWSS